MEIHYPKGRPGELEILGSEGSFIRDFIIEHGKSILHSEIFQLAPDHVRGVTLDQQMLIRKIVNDKDHPWMKPWYRKVAAISIGTLSERDWSTTANVDAPEDEEKIKYELEMLGPFYSNTRGYVDRLGKGILELEPKTYLYPNCIDGIIFINNDDQVILLKKIIHEIVHDENHQWMLDHAASKAINRYYDIID